MKFNFKNKLSEYFVVNMHSQEESEDPPAYQESKKRILDVQKRKEEEKAEEATKDVIIGYKLEPQKSGPAFGNQGLGLEIGLFALHFFLV